MIFSSAVDSLLRVFGITVSIRGKELQAFFESSSSTVDSFGNRILSQTPTLTVRREDSTPLQEGDKVFGLSKEYEIVNVRREETGGYAKIELTTCRD